MKMQLTSTDADYKLHSMYLEEREHSSNTVMVVNIITFLRIFNLECIVKV